MALARWNETDIRIDISIIKLGQFDGSELERHIKLEVGHLREDLTSGFSHGSFDVWKSLRGGGGGGGNAARQENLTDEFKSFSNKAVELVDRLLLNR